MTHSRMTGTGILSLDFVRDLPDLKTPILGALAAHGISGGGKSVSALSGESVSSRLFPTFQHRRACRQHGNATTRDVSCSASSSCSSGGGWARGHASTAVSIRRREKRLHLAVPATFWRATGHAAFSLISPSNPGLMQTFWEERLNRLLLKAGGVYPPAGQMKIRFFSMISK